MPLDIAKAVKALDANAQDKPANKCAHYVRLALKAGGIDINPYPLFACNYGPPLLANGFKEVPAKDYKPVAGDVVVIQPYPAGTDKHGKHYNASHPAGHIAMYDGTIWVSDFKQRDMMAGPGYRAHATSFQVYRP